MGIMRTLTINGEKYNVTPVVPAASVTLLADAWVGEENAYCQVVEVADVTIHTKVDLQPTSEQLAEFHHKVLGFVTENDGGVVTVYAIGDKPSGDYSIQATLTEVEGVGKIRGNTVGSTMPRANLEQEDPQKADYVLGRNTFMTTAVSAALREAKESGAFDGEPGQPGISCTHHWDGTTLYVTSESGTSSANLKGDVPRKGIDYFTPEDKQDMVDAVLAALPSAEGVGF